jgi:hypothetical protein
MTQFSAIITPDSISFVGNDGVSYSIQESMSEEAFSKACKIIQGIKYIQNYPSVDDTADSIVINNEIDRLMLLVSPIKTLPKQSNGHINIKNGVVFYDDKPIHSAVTEQIVFGLQQGFDVKPYMLFLDMLYQNTSRRAVKELYGFIERHKMAIDENGYLLAYKKVNEDWYDIHTGKTNKHVIGESVKVERNEVDDNFGLLCSEGLHVCAFGYLKNYASSHNNRVLMVKINPKDVVSIPIDQAAKMRVCEYLVVREIPYNYGDNNNFTEDHLTERSVWNDSDINGYSGVEIGDTVTYLAPTVNYAELNCGDEYVVSKVLAWGNKTFVSVEGILDNNVFLLSEFSVKEKTAGMIMSVDEDDFYEDDSYEDEEDDED